MRPPASTRPSIFATAAARSADWVWIALSVSVCTEIANALRGMSVMDQEAIDRTLIELDGTPNKARLGGNATVAVSMAALHAAAAARAHAAVAASRRGC